MSKVLILTNHSYMLYRFRLELMKKHEVVPSMPYVGHEEDFQARAFAASRRMWTVAASIP